VCVGGGERKESMAERGKTKIFRGGEEGVVLGCGKGGRKKKGGKKLEQEMEEMKLNKKYHTHIHTHTI
jgi:hypothetical protein